MRLIDADALIDRLDYCVKEGMGSTIAFTFKHMVEDAPAIEPKRGEWIDNRGVSDKSQLFPFECSECHDGNERTTNFCPNCGADMRGADDE